MQTERDFIQVLRGELTRRAQKNPRYSLRSFAKFLEIDSSALSKILNRKRPLGQRSIRRFGERIGMSPEQLSEFLPRDLQWESSASGPRLLEQLQLELAQLPESEENFLWELMPLARQLYARLQTQSKESLLNGPISVRLSALEQGELAATTLRH